MNKFLSPSKLYTLRFRFEWCGIWSGCIGLLLLVLIGVFDMAGVKNHAVYDFLGFSFIFSLIGIFVSIFSYWGLDSKIEKVEAEEDLSYFMRTRGYDKSEIDAALKELDVV